MLHASTGTAPSTTTIQLGYHRGTQNPSDFDRARAHLDYLPYTYGWVVGELGQPATGELITPEVSEKLVAHYAARRARALAVKEELEAQVSQETINTSKSNRMWGAVAGLVGIAGVVVAVIALRK